MAERYKILTHNHTPAQTHTHYRCKGIIFVENSLKINSNFPERWPFSLPLRPSLP